MVTVSPVLRRGFSTGLHALSKTLFLSSVKEHLLCSIEPTQQAVRVLGEQLLSTHKGSYLTTQVSTSLYSLLCLMNVNNRHVGANIIGI